MGIRMPSGMLTNISLCAGKRDTYTMSSPSGSARQHVSWHARFKDCRYVLEPFTNGLVCKYLSPTSSERGARENPLVMGLFLKNPSATNVWVNRWFALYESPEKSKAKSV